MARCPRRRDGLAVADAARGGWPAVSDADGPGRLRGTINVVLPVPGDVRGLAAGTQFERDALAAGEAVIIANPDNPATAVGLVPEFFYDDLEDSTDDATGLPELCALSWTVYSLPGAPVFDHYELGDAEYTLRSAVRSAADALGAIGLGSAASTSTIRGDSSSSYWNPHGNTAFPTMRRRAHCGCWRTPRTSTRSSRSARGSVDRPTLRIVSRRPSLPASSRVGTQSSSEARIASDALRPLTAVVRSARMAAVTAILHSAWAD